MTENEGERHIGMAYGQIDYKSQEWTGKLGRYLRDVAEEYSIIGQNCRTRVSNPLLLGELMRKMDERDGNMLVSFFDDMTDAILDNMHMLSNTEIGTYLSCEDDFIEDDDCFELLARTALAAADERNGFGKPKSTLIQWMSFMFLPQAA